MLHRLLFPMAAALLIASPAFAADGVTGGQILIGQSITLKGGKNEYGSAVLAGVQTYFQAVNARGGVYGRAIVLKVLDDEDRPAQAEANARRLATQDKVFLLFGPIEGSPSTAVMKVAIETGVPLFGPMAGSPAFRRPHQPLVFPVRAGHQEEFRELLAYAAKTGVTKAAFVRTDSEVGRLHLENYTRICRELGLQMVADLSYKPDVSDEELGQMAARIGSSGAQVVVNHGGIGVYERLIRKARATQVKASFSAVNSGSAQLARHLDELAHGMMFAQVVPSPWERKSAITREYQEEFKRQRPDHDFSYGSLEGYITAKALVAALRLAGPKPTRESFIKAVESAGTLPLADGLRASYQPGNHEGLSLVTLAIYTREGRFMH
jgi:branched-chain amino acid transport system substrate-binding protein